MIQGLESGHTLPFNRPTRAARGHCWVNFSTASRSLVELPPRRTGRLLDNLPTPRPAPKPPAGRRQTREHASVFLERVATAQAANRAQGTSFDLVPNRNTGNPFQSSPGRPPTAPNGPKMMEVGPRIAECAVFGRRPPRLHDATMPELLPSDGLVGAKASRRPGPSCASF